MAARAKLVALALALACGSAFAGYAQPSPPAGFSQGSGGYLYKPGANDALYGRVAHQPGGLTVNVGGQSVRMGAGYRFAANAPRIAAGIIFNHPALRTIGAVATLLGVGSVVWNEAMQRWEAPRESEQWVPDGYQYWTGQAWQDNPSTACNAMISSLPTGGGEQTYTHTFIGLIGSAPVSHCRFRTVDTYQGVQRPPTEGNYPLTSQSTGCPVGSVPAPGGGCSIRTTENVPLENADDLHRILNPDNQPGWPQTWPKELPRHLPQPLPVEQPAINPAPMPSPVPSPVPDPASRPMRVPQGDPVPVPETNPQQWRQPYIDIVPSPTPDSPWRVDLRPGERITTGDSPVPIQEPVPVPDTPPEEGTTDKPKTDDQKGLCELFPDIVACAKLGDIEAQDVPTQEKTLQITPESGFGPANGTCPAPAQAMVGIPGYKVAVEFSWQPMCDFANGIRPVVLAVAWLAAALMFVAAVRETA